jgi:hypothetical protein
MTAPAEVGAGETSKPGLAVTAASLPEALVTAVVVHGAATNRVKRVRRTKAGEALARLNEATQVRAAADAIAAQRDHRRHRLGAEPAPAMLSSAPAPQERPDSRPRGRTSRRPAGDRKPIRTPGMPADWVALCISMPREALAELDAVIERCRAAGLGKLARSRLIRIAIARLDVDALIPELRRTR